MITLVNILQSIALELSITIIFNGNKASSIGSGAVESAVKQIAHRVKLTGAQWKKENVPHILQLRCTYLNGKLAI